MSEQYHVAAGKYDDEGENCKYCDSFSTFEEALAAYETVRDYPWSRIEYRDWHIHPTKPAE